MFKKVKVAIIGAGSAGLSAQKIVSSKTNDYVVIDSTPLGTTCARVGCMPSKVLIHLAHVNYLLNQKPAGYEGVELVKINLPQVMQHVRDLRDYFVAEVLKTMEPWKENHFIQGQAEILDPQTLRIGKKEIKAESIILAAGSSPEIPKSWDKFKDYLIDTNAFFEQTTLPKKMAVIGLGAMGLALGQALSHLGVEIVGINFTKEMADLTDPKLLNLAKEYFSQEMQLYFNKVEMKETLHHKLGIQVEDQKIEVPLALVTTKRQPNLKDLKIENLGVALNEAGVPRFNQNTLQVDKLKVFIAGDANNFRPILHEATDEGCIAGYNALQTQAHCFERRLPLRITFTTPNMAVVGQNYAELIAAGSDFIVGKASYQDQGRATAMEQNIGEIHIYAQKQDGLLFGSELIAPAGEHLAHLLAAAITHQQKLADLLKMPFYHPVLEEGLRSAFKDAAEKIDQKVPELELIRC